MATKPENDMPATVVKEQKALKHQDKEVADKQPPPAEVPAGNPREHPTRQTR